MIRHSALLLALAVPTVMATGQTPPKPAGETASPEASARDILYRFTERTKKIQTLRGTFEQKVKTPVLRKPLVTSGSLLFRRDPACAILQINKPGKSVARFDERSYQVYRPSKKTCERWLFERDELGTSLVKVLAPTRQDVDEAFTVGEMTRKDGLVTIQLNPRHKKAKGYVRKLAVTLHEESLQLRRILYTNRDGDKITISLQGLKENQKIGEKEFSRDVPKGTKLQVNKLEKKPGT